MWCALLLADRARAEEDFARFIERLYVRGSAHVGLFVSRDQLDRFNLAYDRFGMLGDLQLGVSVRARLSLELGSLGGAFLASRNRPTGGLFAPTLGVRVHGTSRRLTPFLLLDGGPALTGELVRPMLRFAVGIDLGIRRGVSLGPVLGLGNVFQKNGPPFSTDGTYLWAGISFAYRPPPLPPPAPKPQVIKVVEREIVREPVVEPAPPEETTDAALRVLIEKALPAPEERVQLLAPVLFAFDSDELEPVGVAMLHEVARLLRERTDIERVAVRGYADRRGSEDYNRALSERRARRVMGWLVEHGIAAERLELEPQGATEFVEPGESESEHQQNRRVVFRVLQVATP